jgi:hypothetical protein
MATSLTVVGNANAIASITQYNKQGNGSHFIDVEIHTLGTGDLVDCAFTFIAIDRS